LCPIVGFGVIGVDTSAPAATVLSVRLRTSNSAIKVQVHEVKCVYQSMHYLPNYYRTSQLILLELGMNFVLPIVTLTQYSSVQHYE